jgi:hypothetical protein
MAAPVFLSGIAYIGLAAAISIHVHVADQNIGNGLAAAVNGNRRGEVHGSRSRLEVAVLQGHIGFQLQGRNKIT